MGVPSDKEVAAQTIAGGPDLPAISSQNDDVDTKACINLEKVGYMYIAAFLSTLLALRSPLTLSSLVVSDYIFVSSPLLRVCTTVGEERDNAAGKARVCQVYGPGKSEELLPEDKRSLAKRYTHEASGGRRGAGEAEQGGLVRRASSRRR